MAFNSYPVYFVYNRQGIYIIKRNWGSVMLDKKTLILIGVGAIFSIVSAPILYFVYEMSFFCISKEVLLAIVTGVVFALPSALLLLIDRSVTGKRNKRRLLFKLQQAIADIRQLVSDNADEETVYLKMTAIQDCSSALNHMQSDYFLLPAVNAKIDDLRNDLFTLNLQLASQYYIRETDDACERIMQDKLSKTIDSIESEVDNILGIITSPNRSEENKQGGA